MHLNTRLYLLFFLVITAFVTSCKPNAGKPAAGNGSDSLANLEAARDLSRQIEAAPDNAELFYQRAQVFVTEKYLNRAEEDFLEAIRLDSLNPLYHYAMARNLYAMNQTQRAATEYEKALVLKPDYQEARMKLASLYLVVKEHQKSVDHLKLAQKQDPGDGEVYHLMGMNYREMGDTGRAIYNFQTAVENDPTDYESTLYLANLYAAQKKALAFEYFIAALKLRPKSAEVYFSRAVFEQQMKLYKAALMDYRRVIDLDPKNYLSYYNVGYLNYENGMLDEALRNWNQCTLMNPDYANAFYMKGLVYEERKNFRDASLQFQVALDLQPENPLFQEAAKRVGSKAIR